MSEPIVLIPGLNCSPALFQPQILAMWQFGPVLLADHRSFRSVHDLAQDVLASAPPRFALGGLSLGGFAALEIYRLAPQRVIRLALIGASARPESHDPAVEQTRNERIEMARNGRFDDIPPLHFARNVHPSRQTDTDLRQAHRSMTREVGAAGYINQQLAIRDRPDARPVLKSIACPTTIIVGDSDFITPPDHSEEMHRAITGSSLAILPGCGHLATLERPDEVTATLVAWRREISQT